MKYKKVTATRYPEEIYVVDQHDGEDHYLCAFKTGDFDVAIDMAMEESDHRIAKYKLVEISKVERKTILTKEKG